MSLTAPFRRAGEILDNWSKQEIGSWYDKQAQIINDYYGRAISELGTGPRKSYDQQKAELEHAFAEAGVSGKAPTPTAEQLHARVQHALQIARTER